VISEGDAADIAIHIDGTAVCRRDVLLLLSASANLCRPPRSLSSASHCSDPDIRSTSADASSFAACDDNSDAAEMNEITFMYDNYIQKAQYFEAEMKQFLIDNKNDYPVYLDKLNKDSIIKNDQYNAKGDQFNEGTGMIII
jgi:hypothetical protein